MTASLLAESIQPVDVGGGWVTFSFGGTGSRVEFSYSSSSSVAIKVTDDFCRGDEFAVLVDGQLIGRTSEVAVGACEEVGPDAAFADPSFSSGTFNAPKGAHTFSIDMVESPFGGGGAYVRLDATKGSVTKVQYANYKWQDLSAFNSAVTVMQLKMDKFLSEADSPWHDNRLNWSNDLCSGPDGIEFIVGGIWWEKFWDSCKRHDFGYRNFGGTGRLDQTADRRTWIDDVFLADMTDVCKKQNRLLRPSCLFSASAFYDAVHFTPWGHNAFFG